jgi:hypothetical protein
VRCHGRRGSRIAPFRGNRWPANRRRRGRRAWRDNARGARSGISPAAARPEFRDVRPRRCRHGGSRARAGGRCGEGCASDASLLPEPAVHRPFLPAARRVAGLLAAFLRPCRRAWRRCGFEQQRANRVKRMRADHTRCMCVESVKRFRIGSARSVARSARDGARGVRGMGRAKCAGWGAQSARDVACEARVIWPEARDARQRARRCSPCAAPVRSPRRCRDDRSAAPQPRRSIGTTGRCEAPV